MSIMSSLRYRNHQQAEQRISELKESSFQIIYSIEQINGRVMKAYRTCGIPVIYRN